MKYLTVCFIYYLRNNFICLLDQETHLLSLSVDIFIFLFFFRRHTLFTMNIDVNRPHIQGEKYRINSYQYCCKKQKKENFSNELYFKYNAITV